MSLTTTRLLKAAVGLVALGLFSSGCDWTMFRYDAAHTGFNTTETQITTANVSTLQQKWTAAVPEGVTSPAAAGGIVYVGSNDNRVYAFSANGSTGCSGSPRTCAPLWRSVGLGGDVKASPAVSNGRVYVTSVGDRLVALDAAGRRNCSGTPLVCSPLWSFGLGPDPTNSPAVVNDVVYVNDSYAYVYAVKGATGESVWTSDYIEDLTTTSNNWASPAVANGTVYAVIADAASGYALYAFDDAACRAEPQACQPKWVADFGVPGTGSPAVANGVVYVTDAGGNLYAFDAAGASNCTANAPAICTPLWTAPSTEPLTGVSTTPAIAYGKVYLANGSGRLEAFDAAGNVNCAMNTSSERTECSPLWTTAVSGLSMPAIANGMLFAGSSSGLHAFNAATGAALWQSSEGAVGAPTIANGYVYAPGGNGLVAYGLP